MINVYRTSAISALALALVCSPLAHAAKPVGAGGGKPGGGDTAPPPNPDIVYLSASNQSINAAEIRGTTLTFATNGSLSSSDSSLLKSTRGRGTSAIAWSPDGKRFAWIENGSIMTATPGGRSAILYPTRASDPRPLANSDALAWGRDCSGTGDSAIAFLSELPSYSIEVLTVQAGAMMQRETLVPLPTHCNQDQTQCTMSGANAFAFSPLGQYLAFYGFADTLAPGVWAASLCVAGHDPTMILDRSNLGSTDSLSPVTSMDWSASGGRLALSVTTGPDPDYPWRDVKIADIAYSVNQGSESIGAGTVLLANPGAVFGTASSELSPAWDPTAAGDSCQRLAFSQSSDAGRQMYVTDLAHGTSCNAALRPIGAKNPRALDWRVKQ